MSDGVSFHWYDIESDPEGWDKEVSTSGLSPFHGSALLGVHCCGKSFRRGVVISRNGRLLGRVGGLLQPGQGGGRYRTLSFPTLGGRRDAAVPKAFVDWLMEQGLTEIELGSLGGGLEGYRTIPNGRIEDRYEFIYDLTRDDEERFKGLEAGHRRKLQISELEGLELRRMDSRQALFMVRFQRRWARLHDEKWGWRRMVAMYRYYRRLTHRLLSEGSADLYGLFDRRGGVHALAFMLERADSCFLLVGTQTDEEEQRGAGVRLFWELARHYVEKGKRTLNLGGVPVEARKEKHNEHDAFRFKAGFGIEPTLRRSLTIES